MTNVWRRRARLSWAVCAACALVSVATTALGQTENLDDILAPVENGGLTSDDVAQRAKDTSYDAEARRQALAVAEASLAEALADYYPKLSVAATYTRLSPVTQPQIAIPGASAGAGFVFPVFLDSFVVQTGLSIPVSDYVLRLSQSYAAASHSKRAAMLDEQASRLKAATDGRVTYYAWLRAKAQAVVALRTLQQSKAHLDDARHAFDAGTSSKADVMGVESQLASSELVLVRATDLAEYTEEQLRTAMHDPSSSAYQVGEDLRQPLPPLSPADDIASLRAEALVRRLELRALDETAWSLKEQARAAKAAYFPRLETFGDVIVANPNSRIIPAVNSFNPTWDVGVRLSWAVSDAANAGNVVSQSRARAAQTEAQKAALADAVGLEVVAAYQAAREAEIAVQTTQRGLAAAGESYRVRRELFRNGRATSVELTDAEVALFRSAIEAINARAEVRGARARLIHAVGRDVPAQVIAP